MQDSRHIENPFFKIFNIINPDESSLYSLLIRLLQQFFKNIKIPTIKSTASDPNQSAQDLSVYTGTAGYLYMFIKAHHFFEKKSQIESQNFALKSHIVGDEAFYKLTDPRFYLKMAEEQYNLLSVHLIKKQKNKDCYSFYMSEVSVWLCGMHLAYLTNNPYLFRENQKRILLSYQNLKQLLNKQIWELLYGVPGFLYIILQLQKAYDKHPGEFKTDFGPIAIELANSIIQTGIREYQTQFKTKINIEMLPQDFRLIYYFHKKQYLGGAHGLGGNISILLSALKQNDFGVKLKHYIQLIKKSIIFLLKHLINGNFTPAAGSNSIKLVHFCHGAPGIVIALAKFADMFPQIGIELALKQVIGANLNHIWRYGVLKKGFGLCHGISGNAYCFISPSVQSVFHDKSAELIKKGRLFALLHEQQQVNKEISQYEFKDRYVVGKSDQPFSLMTGIAGDIYFTMDVLNGTGCFPGYDL